MNPIDIVIIVLASVAVVGFIGYRIWQKKTGKPYDCGCGDCSACHGCPHKKDDKKST